MLQTVLAGLLIVGFLALWICMASAFVYLISDPNDVSTAWTQTTAITGLTAGACLTLHAFMTMA
jgi:hypothetical protein